MESEWRFMVEDIGMGGPLAYAPRRTQQCILAARLNPPLPHPFSPLTHMAGLKGDQGAWILYFGRLLAGSLDVVTSQLMPIGVRWPCGYGVFPDGNGVIP